MRKRANLIVKKKNFRSVFLDFDAKIDEDAEDDNFERWPSLHESQQLLRDEHNRFEVFFFFFQIKK